MPVTVSLLKGLLRTMVFLTKTALCCAAMAVLIACGIAAPYWLVGLRLFRPLGNQEAVALWIHEVFWGTYSLTDILAMWPAYQQDIFEGIQMSWMLMGFCGILMIAGVPLALFVMALLPECQCTKPHKDQA